MIENLHTLLRRTGHIHSLRPALVVETITEQILLHVPKTEDLQDADAH